MATGPLTPALDVSVDRVVATRFPNYRGAVVIASGLANGPSDEASEALLADAEQSLRARSLERVADDPHLAAWRATFSAFGAKPSKYPSSAEALASRVLKGAELPRINALVDIYNAMSVKHLIPLGGEDSDRLVGPLRLVEADGTEEFDPRADGAAVEHPIAGEVAWRDDAGVTCRRWNWRQGRRTQITEATTSAFFIVDTLVPPLDSAALEAVLEELVTHLSARASGAAITAQMIGAGG